MAINNGLARCQSSLQSELNKHRKHFLLQQPVKISKPINGNQCLSSLSKSDTVTMPISNDVQDNRTDLLPVDAFEMTQSNFFQCFDLYSRQKCIEMSEKRLERKKRNSQLSLIQNVSDFLIFRVSVVF